MLALKEWRLRLFIKMAKNIFGLTGGIGSGKTTLVNFLQKNHSEVELFDCDKVAKEIMEEKEIRRKIGEILGEVGQENNLDKKKVARIIFNNPEKKKKIEELIHPIVWNKLNERIKKIDEKSIILVESAILFDLGKEKDMPNIIATVCDLDERKKRIKARNKWSEREIEERIRNQISDKLLTQKTTIIIDTNCSLDQLEEKTEKLYQILINWKNEKLRL